MINRVVLIGRMTKDAEIKTYQGSNGMSSVAKFTLAVNRDKDNTDFIPCTAFGKTADVLQQYTSKGSQIAVEGSLRQNRWTTQSGENRSTLDVNVNRIELLGSKNDSKAQNNSDMNNHASKQETAKNNNLDLMYDELPF